MSGQHTSAPDIVVIGEPMAEFNQVFAAAKYANAAAAIATTGFGAVAPLPRPEAVRQLLATP